MCVLTCEVLFASRGYCALKFPFVRLFDFFFLVFMLLLHIVPAHSNTQDFALALICSMFMRNAG
jgi:hypothetical protein